MARDSAIHALLIDEGIINNVRKTIIRDFVDMYDPSGHIR